MTTCNLDLEALLEGGVHRMSHVYRFSSLPTLRKENVAEHTFYVTLYAYLLAKDIECKYDIEIDYADILSRAMLHDVEESHTGDFLKTVKYGHPGLKGALEEVAFSMVRKIGEELGVSVEEQWGRAKADDFAGQLIEIADLARVISYALEEIKVGNTYMKPILEEVKSYYDMILVNNAFTTYPFLRVYAEEMKDYVDRKISELR